MIFNSEVAVAWIELCLCAKIMAFACVCCEQNVIVKPEMIPYTAQMDVVSYGTGKWSNPYADKSGAYIFLPDGPAKVIFLQYAIMNIY